MKRLTGIVLLSVFCFFCSCRQAQLEEPNANSENVGQNLQEVELSLIMPGGKTKTSLGLKDGDSYPVYWEEGDVITLNGKRSAAVSAGDAGSASACISVKTDAVSPFNILYPGVDGVADQVTFPSTQVYREGSFDANALPMYATASSLKDEISLNYLASVLRIPMKFTSATTLRRITVTALNGEPLSGSFFIGKTAGALNGELTAETASKTVSYAFGENGTTFAAGEAVFHIALPKGTYEGGLELRIYDTEGNYMSASAFSLSKTVEAGKVYEFPQHTYIPDGKVFLIETPKDLQTLAAMTNTLFLEVHVVNNIDMTGQSYNSDSFNFYGTLDGGGYTISGLTRPLFNNMQGTVRNLTIDANVVYEQLSPTTSDLSVNNSYGIGLLAHYARLTSDDERPDYDDQIIENVTVNGSLTVRNISPSVDYKIGGILGASNTVPMVNCTNNANIKVEGFSTSKLVNLGGVSGAMQSNKTADLLGCVNTGSITFNGSVNGEDLHVGGVAGYSTQPIDVKNVRNSGKITIGPGSADNLYVAGIITASSSSNLVLDNAEQTADAGIIVSSDFSTATAYYVGGIAASNSFKISNVVNRGPISVSGATNNGNVSVGGIIGRCQGPLTNAANYAVVDVTESLSVTCPDGLYLGGVIGNANNTNTALTAPLYNEGSVKCAATVNRVAKVTTGDDGTESTTYSGGSLYMGGLVGAQSNGSYTSSALSENKGAVIVTGVTTGYRTYIGGAYGEARKSITNIKNTGALTVSDHNSTEFNVGGLVGYLNGAITVNGCTNDAPVTISGTPHCLQSIGGLFGIKSKSNTTLINCVNGENGDVTYTGGDSHSQRMYMAGVVALCQADGQSSISGCKNYGDITNSSAGVSSSSSTEPAIAMGGIIAHLNSGALALFEGCENHGNITNDCPSTHSSSAAIRIGGIIASAHQAATLSSAKNFGDITNNGASATTVKIGGLIGHAQSTWTLATCSNEGNVTLTGEHVGNTFTGGVIGFSQSSTTATYAKNSGDVTYNATSKNAFLGGLFGLFDDDDRDLDIDISYSENSGPVTVSGSFAGMYIGGVLGSVGLITADYIKNTAPVTVKNTNIGTQVWLAGCIGRLDSGTDKTEATLTGMENSGAITMKEGITSTSSSYQYMAGVLASGDSSNKTLENCHNTGIIDARPSEKQPLKIRIGGLAGIINKNPDGSSSKADIKFYGTKGSCHVGGLVGHLNVSTYENLTFKGTVYTNGTSGTNYVGGLVGNVSSGSKTFTNCAVYGTIHGANNSTGAGVFYNSEKSNTASFTSCKVGNGTRRKSTGDGAQYDYSFNMTTQITDDIAKNYFAIRSTAATVTDCVVVDPSTL